MDSTSMKRVQSFLIVATVLLLATSALAAPFNRTQELEVQYISLGSTYYPHVLAEHEERESLIRAVGQSPNADLTATYGPYLVPTMYNTILFLLYPDGTATAEMLDPNDHMQTMLIMGTYQRQGRRLTIDLDDVDLQIFTVFTGKASKDSKKCYQGTSEAPQPGFPGSFWVTYWEGCRARF